MWSNFLEKLKQGDFSALARVLSNASCNDSTKTNTDSCSIQPIVQAAAVINSVTGTLNDLANARKYKVTFSEHAEGYGTYDRNTFTMYPTYEKYNDSSVPFKILNSGYFEHIDAIITPSDSAKNIIFYTYSDLQNVLMNASSGGIQISPVKAFNTPQAVQLYSNNENKEDAIYAGHKDNAKVALGKIKVFTAQKKAKTLTIVTVHSLKKRTIDFHTIVSEQEIKDYLNKLYGTANVSWDITFEADLTVNFDLNGDGMLNTSDFPTDEINVLKAHYPAQKSYVLFMVDNLSEKGLLGIMGFNQPFGIVCPHCSKNKEQLLKTIAHELGHGAFSLQHPWDQLINYNCTPCDNWSTPGQDPANLMDYQGGDKLRAYQIEQISNPQ